MSHLGAAALFGGASLVHLGLAGFALRCMRQRRPPPAEEQIPFIDALRSAETVSPVIDIELQAGHGAQASAQRPVAAAPRGANPARPSPPRVRRFH